MRKNYTDHFELLYLRHDYLSRAGELNGEYIKKYSHIIDITSCIMYKNMKFIFSKVGFTLEDVKTISSMYALIYMNLYSIENQKEQKSKFVKLFMKKNEGRQPSQDDLDKAEQSHMINFIRQKLSRCADICNRKSRNIICGKDRHGFFAFTSRSIPASQEQIMENPAKYGYRVVSKDEHKESLERAKTLREKQTVDEQGYKIFQIDIFTMGIGKEDYQSAAYPAILRSAMSAEDKLIEEEEKLELSMFKNKFYNMSDISKERALSNFINKFNKHSAYAKQVKLAKKMLRTKDFVVR